MENEIVFRRLGPSDTKKYRSLRLECLRDFPENFGATLASEAARPKLRMEIAIEAESPTKFVIGAFSDQTLIGQVAIYQEENPRQLHVGQVVQMYVQPQFSGQKVGLNMLKFAIASAWEIEALEQLRLEVVTTSLSAIHVYQQAGFEQNGVYKQQMKIGNIYKDAIAMVLFKTGMAS